jgi:hypothetical protein
MGGDTLNFFCDDDFDPLTSGPDEWTEEDQKKLNEIYKQRKKELDKERQK